MTPDLPLPPETPAFHRRLLAGIRRHPWKTAFLVLSAFVLFEVATLPWFEVPRLAGVNPGETALMRQRIREAAGEGRTLKIRQRWIPIQRLPQSLLDAVIVAEDGTFYSHGGFDWFEVRESMEKNWRTGRFARGGSTITQQLAKNLFLSTSKDPLRKLKEAAISVMLERWLDKRRILELYLNVIEWGPGVFGVEAASQTYYGKSASALAPGEAVRLAAVIPSPLKHRPTMESRYVLRRAAIVQRRLDARARGIPITVEEDESSPDSDEVAEPVRVRTDTTSAGGSRRDTTDVDGN